jgi:hypothetical protein
VEWSGRRDSNPRRPAWEDDCKLETKNIAFPGITFWRKNLPSFRSVPSPALKFNPRPATPLPHVGRAASADRHEREEDAASLHGNHLFSLCLWAYSSRGSRHGRQVGGPPARKIVVTGIVRQFQQFAAVRCHSLDLRDAVAVAPECDESAVRRPDRPRVSGTIVSQFRNVGAIGVHRIDPVVAALRTMEDNSPVWRLMWPFIEAGKSSQYRDVCAV